MTDCLNCFNCRIVKTKLVLRCKAGFWINADGNEKIVKLTKTEVVNSHISFRNLFSQAKKCPSLSE